MKQTMKYTVIALLAFALVSCSDDKDGTNSPTVAFSFKTNTSSINVPAGRVQANTLEFTSGTIRLSRIEFEAETDEADSVEVEIERTIEIDFATGETSPNLDNLVFAMGTYTEARVELEILDENSNPSVVIEGTFTDAENETHPIRFEFNSGETFEVEKEGRIVFGEGASVLAEVTFDPGVWFAGVTREELSAATKNNDGVIVISETSNAEIFDIVVDGLDLATEVEITL
ncbi:hypothetical protein QWY93_15845 [Echinicola jeungdonensis]|uniref:DUF4382 domain-containing protein n=1 Tax=Echinicola jeungdonensis TaxID=709343 RepID=A0ABV5J6W8_9BACT|nr:hypothetical protein [Echinicola jeungdonensis]MDN3670793.1 hypothetical protein [Echinicola jeungdonensis]